MIAALKYGFTKAKGLWRIAFLILLVQLILGLFIGSSVSNRLGNALQHTKAAELFSQGFDYQIFQDMMRVLPETFSGFSTKIILVICIYLLVSIWLHAGVIGLIAKGDNKLNQFVAHANRFFLPFLGYGLIFFVITALFAGLIFFPILSQSLPLVEWLESDRLFFYILFAAIGLFLMLVSILLHSSIASRLVYVSESITFFKAFKFGFGFSIKKFFGLLSLFLFFLFLGILAMWFSAMIQQWISGASFLPVLVSFVLVLMLVFVRIFFRVWYYAAVFHKQS